MSQPQIYMHSYTKNENKGNSLVVQWLGLCTFIAKEGLGAVPGRGGGIPQGVQHSQKKKKNPTFSLGIIRASPFCQDNTQYSTEYSKDVEELELLYIAGRDVK